MRKLSLCVALLALAGCGEKPKPLPVLGEVPDFVLTDQQGKEFHGSSLKGKVWVANFIFTNCTGPCPRMSSRMMRLQGETAPFGQVKLVSFTVDPARDTPEVLAAYAKRFQAEPDRWRFLTGPRAELHHLSREAFRVGNVDGTLNHSTHFVLVDQRARIRGYYGMSDSDVLEQLVRDIKRLLEESA